MASNGVDHSDEREYRCKLCGRRLFRVRGTLVSIEIDVMCSDRRCKRPNKVDLSVPQLISDAQRVAWQRLRSEVWGVPTGFPH